MTGTHRGFAQDRVPQARIYRVWNVPGIATKEDALFDMAAQILGGGKTSRLYKRLVRQDQLASSAIAYNASSEIGGQFQMQLTARPGADSRKMEAAADQELQALLKNGPTEAEVQLARTTILADYARRAERIGGFGGKSDLLAQCMTFQGNPECYKQYVRHIREATPASLHKAMKEWLSEGDYVLEVQPFPTVTAEGSGFDRKAGVPTGQAQALQMPPLQKLTLSNGLKVLVAERHTAPVVNLSLMVDSGHAADPQDLPGLTNLTRLLLEEGTATRSAEAISEQVERLGATLGTSANLDGVFVNMNALRTTLPQALELFADVALHPAFPQAELDRVRKQQLAAIAREKTTPEDMAQRVLPGLLFGNGHAYSRPSSGTGTEAAVSRISREDLLKYHRTWFRPNNATLLVVGDTTAEQVKPLLEKAFTGWAAADVPKKNISPVKPPEKLAVYLLDRPGSLQSVIVGGQVTQAADAAELVQMQLVNNVLGGTFSSRMNMNLREDKHWSYGVYSTVRPAVGQRALISVSPVQSDKTAEALKEIVNDYAGIAGGKPITAAELKQSRDRETLALPGRFETAAQLSTAYANVLQYRLPEDYYTRFTPTALAFTPEQANALAKKFVLPNQQVWVVVGDMSKVEAGIRALNIGEVRRIDADGKVLQ
jgi:zinc protease